MDGRGRVPPTTGFFWSPAPACAAASRATVAMYCATYAACTSAGGTSSASTSAFAAAAEGPEPGVAAGDREMRQRQDGKPDRAGSGCRVFRIQVRMYPALNSGHVTLAPAFDVHPVLKMM